MRGSRGAGAPQLPGSRRWEVGSGSCSLAANLPRASAKHCKCSRRNRCKSSRCRPRSLLPERGVRQRALGSLGCSGHLRPSAQQRIAACFFFPAVSSSVLPAEPDECFALRAAEYRGGAEKIQGWKNSLTPWEYHGKTAPKYSAAF